MSFHPLFSPCVCEVHKPVNSDVNMVITRYYILAAKREELSAKETFARTVDEIRLEMQVLPAACLLD